MTEIKNPNRPKVQGINSNNRDFLKLQIPLKKPSENQTRPSQAMGYLQQIKRGDIWLVSLDPTIGHEIKKSRPAVIIQNDLGNKYSPITIIAPITSQGIEKIYPIEVLLTKKNSGLDTESKALLNQIRAVDKRRLIRKLGKLDEDTLAQVDEAIKISVGLVRI